MADITNLAGTIKQIRSLNDAIKDLEERRDLLKKTIIEALAGDETGSINGATAVTYKITTSTTVDIKKLRAMLPDVAQEYSLTRTSQRFTIVDELEQL